MQAEINEPVNAPVTNYTIVCIDSLSGNACYSADIKSTCCDSKEKVCKHKYNLSLSTCSHQGDIIVRVSATNVFGSGLPGNTTVGKHHADVNDLVKKLMLCDPHAHKLRDYRL